MNELKPYTVESDRNGTMRPKNNPSERAVKNAERRPIFKITHDECVFFVNNGVQWARIRISDTFLRPKKQDRCIMALEFLFSFDRLDLESLSSKKQAEVVKKTRLNMTKTVEVFEYRKNDEWYWDRVKLHRKMFDKTLPTAEVFYQDSPLFLFDNANSHFVYVENFLRTKVMNKKIRWKQTWLCNGRYYKDGIWIVLPKNFEDTDGSCTQKKMQRVFEKQKFWSQKG